ncbi:MAG TPA: hypothetical protein VMT05_07000 [Terriglobales bacterium]|jgi:hypothetical protein|nr:hypothetical protein [Terriglobales bacterium]
MSLSLAIFILVAILVVGGFALGTQRNIHRGNDAMAWAQSGLKLVGEKTTVRWLGSSVVQLKIQNAKRPFREVEVLFVLEPRDILPLWWLARARGRRDLFIFRSRMHRLPEFEFEALEPTAWSARGHEARLRRQKWHPVPARDSLVAYWPEPAPAAHRLLDLAALSGCPLLRLSLQRNDPNFEVHWSLAELKKLPASTVFETLRKLGELA